MNMKKYLPSQGEVIFGVVWSVYISAVWSVYISAVFAPTSAMSIITYIGVSLGSYLVAGIATKLIKDKYENSKTY